MNAPAENAQDEASSAKKLYGRASKTAASRFNAARRLKQLNQASLWTIALFSLGLIFVSLMQALDFSLPYGDRTVNLVQVFFLDRHIAHFGNAEHE
jgi:putative exporter of polyketide antibiotics